MWGISVGELGTVPHWGNRDQNRDRIRGQNRSPSAGFNRVRIPLGEMGSNHGPSPTTHKSTEEDCTKRALGGIDWSHHAIIAPISVLVFTVGPGPECVGSVLLALDMGGHDTVQDWAPGRTMIRREDMRDGDGWSRMS